MNKGHFFNITLLIALVAALLPVGAMAAPPDPPDMQMRRGKSDILIERGLQSQLISDETAGYMIYFRERPDLSPAYKMDWESRGHFVVEALRKSAERAQADVRAYLDAQGGKYQAFWIDNVIVVEASNAETFNGLMSFPEIEALRARRQPFLHEPVSSETIRNAINAVESNLTHINVDDVWAMGHTGQNIVVANIDTGARYTHEALVDHYRGNLGGGTFSHDYNWYDPYDFSASPNDPDTSAPTHGSHTMGTIVGDDGNTNQIGVAPGAEWIACQGFNPSGTEAGLLACGQFMAAPTDTDGNNPNASLRPHIVNNSWGDCGNPSTYDGWYEGVIDSWHAAGIYPVFSNGNERTLPYGDCPVDLGQVGNPARYSRVTGVGALGRTDGTLGSYSLWGPTDQTDTWNPLGYADLKPQVSAPGTNRSVLGTSDTGYQDMSGTSMAAPHVSGVIALMWSAAPCLMGNYTETETILMQTTMPASTGTSYPGSTSDGPGGVPNQATGWGEIDALAAVQAAEAYCGDTGILNGTVTEDGSGDPIENALVVASNPTRTVSLSTNAMGFYSNTIPAEAYTLMASAYGYNPSTVTNINVISGSTTTQDFALTAGDSYLLSGTVTDANTGWGLFASVEIIPDGFPAETVWTDPWTGAYSVTVAGNYSHTLNVSVWDGIPGYVPQSREININSDTVEDFALDVDEVACDSPGYSYSYVYLQDFETDNGSYTSSGDWQWGTPTTWPSSCASGTQCWGTNLSGNYSNNANANLTSTVIDLTGEIAPLTATWWQASYMENASWDHAYAEVSINGGAWQVMWEHTGGTTQIDWEEKTYDISAAANGNVQFRFRITSDGSVNYDGYYIDRLSITGADACNAPADGGLLAGSVYDANTSEAVTGAEVRNTLGEMVVAQETPGANTISEAFYAIYAPAGSQTFTATMSMYQDSVVTGYPVQDGVTQGQDFFMPAGYPQVNPAALHAFLKPGMSATQQLVIDNGSTSIPFDFEIAEVAGGLNPADEDVLVVAVDSDAASAMETALTNLGYSYLEVSQAVFQGMTVQELLAYPAIFHAGYHATGSEANLMGYLDGGGSLYISDNDEGYYRNSSTLYDSYLQATYVSDDPGIDNLIGEDIMTGLDLDISADPYPDDFTVGVDGTQIFQYTGGNAAGVAVARNGYKAIYTSFDFDDIVSVSNEEELIRRITDFFGMGDIAWLTETPITGTVASSGAQTIDVTFDASSLAPGIYTGTLRVASDTPYSPQDVPVELTVGTDYASVQTGNWTGSAWPGGTGTPTANDIVTVTAGTTVTVDSASAACYGLHVEPGGALIIPQGHNLTVEGYVENYGKMVQTKTVLDTTYTELLHLRNQAGDETHHYGVEITPDGTGLGETTVSIWGHHESTTADEPGDTENRRIDIDPTAQHAAAVRFYYLQSELESGHNYTQVRAWHWDDPGWSLVGAGATTGSLDEYYYVEETGVTAYSPFVLKDSSTVAPTAVGLIGLAGQGSLLAAMLVLGLIAAGVVVRCLWHAGKAVSRK